MPTTEADRTTWSPEREIVLSRVLDAPRHEVHAAWTSPDIGSWFRPRGFTCTIHEMDVRPGGRWRIDLTAPDGENYPNRIEYLEVVPDTRLVFDHGSDSDDDLNRFRVMVVFDDQLGHV